MMDLYPKYWIDNAFISYLQIAYKTLDKRPRNKTRRGRGEYRACITRINVQPIYSKIHFYWTVCHHGSIDPSRIPEIRHDKTGKYITCWINHSVSREGWMITCCWTGNRIAFHRCQHTSQTCSCRTSSFFPDTGLTRW